MLFGFPIPRPHGGELVLGIDLIRQAKTATVNVASLHSRLPIQVEGIGRLHERKLLAPAQQEPELVLLERSTEGTIEVFDSLHGGLTGNSAVPQCLSNVAAHELRGNPSEEEVTVGFVTAIAGNEVGDHAATRDLHGVIGIVIGHFLHQRIVDVDLDLSVVLRGVHHHSVEEVGVAR